MSLSMVHGTSGSRAISGADTKGFSYTQGSEGFKSHSNVPFPEMGVLTVPFQQVRVSAGVVGGQPVERVSSQLGCLEGIRPWLAGWKEGPKAGGGWLALPGRVGLGLGGWVGNLAESQVLGAEYAGGGGCRSC